MAKMFDETLQILDGPGGKSRIVLEKGAVVRIGANGGAGYVAVYSKDADQADLNGAPSLVMEGDTATLWVGTKGLFGEVLMFPKEFDQRDRKLATIHLNAQTAELRMGGLGKAGRIQLFPSDGQLTKSNTASIDLDGDAGDIILRNADAAEEFDVDGSEDVESGTVMVIGDRSKLRPCREPYDRRVAGVLAGAGGVRPGIVLGRQADGGRRLPVALMGRVFCKADARFAVIEPGDLLTSSPTPGHAMKATDPARAFGAVIGKAMGTLQGGTGLIPVLVALQ